MSYSGWFACVLEKCNLEIPGEDHGPDPILAAAAKPPFPIYFSQREGTRHLT
jgi:hypothetical protein